MDKDQAGINKYKEICLFYDRLMLAGYYDYDGFLADLMALVDHTPAMHVLEIGVGTGLVASRLIREKRIDFVGVDFSEDMIAICSKNYPELQTIMEDIADFASDRDFELIYSVGGPWYFVDDSEQLLFCSHLPSQERQSKSIANVCGMLRPGGVLALAIQGPHRGSTRRIDPGLIYEQVIRPRDSGGRLFEKDYVFRDEGGGVLSQQTCLFQLSEKSFIDGQFEAHGLRPVTEERVGRFVLYRKGE